MTWAQTHRDPSDTYHDTFGGHVQAGYNILHTVKYVPAGCYNISTGMYTGCLQNFINTDLVDTTWDPSGYWPSGNWNLEYSEESLFFNGNVPGQADNQASVGAMSFLSNSYTWLTTDCGLINYATNDSFWAHSFNGDCANQTLYTAHAH